MLDIAKILELKDAAPSEQALLGEFHPLDVGQPWMGKDTYRLYHAIGAALRPTSLVEIGVRFGYSMRSMALGSGALRRSHGFDNEYDLRGSLAVARSRLDGIIPELHLTELDTQRVDSLGVADAVDLVHVDGWHTADGCHHDCLLALGCVKPNGIILVDDMDSPDVKAGAERFCAEHRFEPHFLPCYHGMYVIEARRGE